MTHGRFRSVSAVLGVAAVLICAVVSGGQDPGQDDAETSKAASLVGNKTSRTYHLETCPLATRLPAKSKVALETPEAAEQGGYKPCPQCKPKSSPAKGDDSKPKTTAGKSKSKPKAPAAANVLRFSRDIAPILAGNCNTCHNAEQKKGDFVISTFESLMKGSKSGPVIIAGKPEESLLVELITERKMPRGGNRTLSDDAIAKIREWVKQGALLDSGVSPTAPLDQVAPTPEQLRKEQLAQLPEDEVTAKLEQTGRERWKKATSKSEPKVTASRGFLIFSELPEDRAKALGRSLDATRTTLGNLFASDPANVLNGPEKISVYVFNTNNVYAEFLRAEEQREVELGAEAHARLAAEAPYIAAIDPHGGAAEPAAPKGKSSKKKDAEALLAAPLRGLPALATEALARGVLEASGKPPRWLAEGFGAYMAAQVEPRGPYFSKLRAEAAQQYQIGGATRLTEALGDQASPEAIRALGFSLCEWMASSARNAFPNLILGMTQEGTTKLDDIIKACFGPESNRDDLLGEWAGFIATRYGARRR